MNNSNDQIFDHIINNNQISVNFYPQIIKAICSMLEKGINTSKINLIFKPKQILTKLEDLVSKYQAFCIYTLDEPASLILDNTDFVKDNKKKPLRVPEFKNELKTSKFFQRTQDHNILIYDKLAEFNLRNKILECCIRVIQNEIDTKPIYKTFNDLYDTFMEDNTRLIENTIQTYIFRQSEFQV
jgi:hypothetical protein